MSRSDKGVLLSAAKTDIFPIKNDVDYLGWHFYMSETGKVIRKVKQSTKYKYKRKLRYYQKAYSEGNKELSEISQVISSYYAHLPHGNTYRLKKRYWGILYSCEMCDAM